MYFEYWNLRESPFQNVSDARYMYFSDQHQEALARLLYLVEGNKLGGMLVGPYGVGKSMVLESLAKKVRDKGNSRFLLMDASRTGVFPLAKKILRGVGCSETVYDTAEVLDVVEAICNESRSEPSRLVLAIDEAHLLREAAAFEFLHLLSNIRLRRNHNSAAEPAVTLILSGHNELLTEAQADGALCQRLQMVWRLGPLNHEQTVEYVQSRIRVAGGDMWIFEENALSEAHKASGGIPRVINNICDVAMVMGAADRASKIDATIMRRAIAEVNPALTAPQESNT